MGQFAFFALILWPAVVFFLFEKFSVVKAIVFAFVAAWLFLPPIIIGLSGVPDWTKMSATVSSVTLCLCLKQPQRLLGVVPRWFDLPVLAYCTIPFVASITNGLGAYDGLSACLDEIYKWGLPYLIGRAYLATPAGNRQLCLGIAIGGFIYVPFCLAEIRLSPQIMQWVYGVNGGAISFGLRYGGYRPMVFLSTGLELGWWMCCATLAAFMLWRSGDISRLWGYPMWALTLGLALVTVACKATGALLQISLGFALIYASRALKKPILVWALLAVGPSYCINRPLGVWTGEYIVPWIETIFGPDRAESISFRFINEEILMQSALQRPFFGWARFGGFNMPGPDGKTAVTDGLWIIVFGWMGFGGLIALNGMLLVPSAMFLVRFKPKTWFDPAVAPLATHAMLLPLFMLDNLSNAMLNPIYAIAMGALAGAVAHHDPNVQAHDRPGHNPIDGGWEPGAVDAPSPGRRGSPRDQAADRLEGEAAAAASRGQWGIARGRFEEAILARLAAIDTGQSVSRADRLARTYVGLARLLTRMGEFPAAIAAREQALAAWGGLGSFNGLDDETIAAHRANLNDLAWRLIQDESVAKDQIDRAVLLAEEALRLDPEASSCWNTLGLARYRRGDHHRAIHALGQSITRSRTGGNAFDFYYLALANFALGYPRPASEWLARAHAWEEENPAWAGDLMAARREIARRLDAMPPASA